METACELVFQGPKVKKLVYKLAKGASHDPFGLAVAPPVIDKMMSEEDRCRLDKV